MGFENSPEEWLIQNQAHSISFQVTKLKETLRTKAAVSSYWALTVPASAS